MIRIYKKKAIPNGMEKIELNDVYFNKTTVSMLEGGAADIIYRIDKSKMIDKYTVESRFDGSRLNIDKLSTGCKTALNIWYNPDKVFDIRECGDNAIDVIYAFDKGNIYCDYPLISFEMKEVEAVDAKGSVIVNDYEVLKEWWNSEN